MTRVTGVAKSERFLRAAAGIDVDKDDVERCNDFINQKVYDQLLIGQANARANEHDMVQPHDLPITKGLQDTIQEFPSMDAGLDVEPLRRAGANAQDRRPKLANSQTKQWRLRRRSRARTPTAVLRHLTSTARS